jgi:hypothetical protein
MRRSIATVALVVTVGCTGSTQGVAPSPAATVSPTSTAVSPSPGATPSPSPADLPLSSIPLGCKLPVVKSLTGGDYESIAGGFVSFPDATFQADPKGVINSEYLAQDFATIATPVLHGSPQTGPPYYDVAWKRWIPAGSGQSSPDGASYAYSLPNSISAPAPWRIHVVDIARATEKVFTVAMPQAGTPSGIRVADFDSGGVYFVTTQSDGFAAGVWLMDPATGRVRALAQLSGVMMVRNGVAWVGRVDPHDPSPPSASGRRLYDTIVSVNLATGAETNWYYNPSHSVVVRGLDSLGHPVVSVSFAPDYPIDTSEMRLIDTPGTGGESNGELVYGGGPWLSDPQADGDRLWFGSDRGIYLYTPAAGMQKVFAFTSTASEAIQPVGFCT